MYRFENSKSQFAFVFKIVIALHSNSLHSLLKTSFPNPCTKTAPHSQNKCKTTHLLEFFSESELSFSSSGEISHCSNAVPHLRVRLTFDKPAEQIGRAHNWVSRCNVKLYRLPTFGRREGRRPRPKDPGTFSLPSQTQPTRLFSRRRLWRRISIAASCRLENFIQNQKSPGQLLRIPTLTMKREHTNWQNVQMLL